MGFRKSSSVEASINDLQLNESSINGNDGCTTLTCEEGEARFRELYHAAIRDTAPSRLWVPLFTSLLLDRNSASTLVACAQENDPRDILLQVRLAIAIWKRHNDPNMLEFIAKRISLIAHLTNAKWQSEICAVLSSLECKGACPPIRCSTGTLIMLGMSGFAETNDEEVAKWVAENFSLLEALPIALLALGKLMDKLHLERVRETWAPLFSRLLLRSPLTTLNIISGMGSFERLGDLLTFLGDAFTSQFCSENDDLREKSQCLLIKTGPTFDYFKLFTQVYQSKSVKIKRSLLATLYKVIKRSNQGQVDMALLRSWLTKESNDELSYFILCCMVLVDPRSASQELEKLSRPSQRLIHLAALSIVVPYEVKPFASMLSQKDLSSTESLCLAIILADSDVLKTDWIKGGLKPLGFLSEKSISESLSKFPLLPIHRLLGLMHFISTDFERSKILWKSLLGCCKLKELISHASSLPGPFPTESLAQACNDLAAHASHGQINAICKLVGSCIRSRADTVPFYSLSFEQAFDQVNFITRMRRSKGFSNPIGLEAQFPKIFELLMSKNLKGNCKKALLDALPEAIPYFGARLLDHVEKISSIPVSKEDHQILEAEETKLPIVDVLTPLRRAQELAARKDPSKRSSYQNLPNSSSGGLTKQEKAALDTELQREKSLRERLTNLKHATLLFSENVNLVAESKPQLLEETVGRVFALLEKLPALEWILPEVTALLYALSKCCHLPIGRYGPLLITCFLVLSDLRQYVDHNWCILDAKECVSAIEKHVEGPPTSKATWSFMLPILLSILKKAQDIELAELQATFILNMFETNASNALEDPNLFCACITAIASALSYLPSILQSSIRTIHGLIRSFSFPIFMVPQQVLAKLLSTESRHVRQFGLEVIRGLIGKSPEFSLERSLCPFIFILLADEYCFTPAVTIAEAVHLREDTIELNDIIQLLVDDTLGENFGTNIIKAICGLSKREVSWPELIAEYKSLLVKQSSEMVSVRAKNQDLTANARKRVSLLFKEMAVNNKIFETSVCEVLNFYLTCGLYDVCEEVRTNFLNSVPYMLDNVKSEAIFNSATSSCEALLSSKSKTFTEDAADKVRVYGVIIMSKLADRFSKEDPRRNSLLGSLVSLLATPSECVQHAVGDAMINLFATADAAVVSNYALNLLEGLLRGKSVAVRRGCAYGLGALCKGFGSRALKHFEILLKLTKVLQDKNEPMEAKQGALFGLELQAFYLGRSFEPYIILLLDCLLVTFADGRTEIKEATTDAADMMMRSVTSLGAQLILPILLSLLDSNSWRSKVGALEWLGAMANLAPRVLTKQLPSILPRILDSLGDSHHSVQKASREALHRYIGVVRNPEIKALALLIMEALANPPEYTEKCLDAVLHTTFAHVIDASSMALLEPVLVRGLRDRGSGGTEVKKKAAQILGNLATNLIDPRDLCFFLGSITPALMACLSDPVPEVRANCGKVLGILVETAGEGSSSMKALVPDLFATIGGPFASGVDRAGAAQALAEIIAARGPEEVSVILGDQVLGSLSSDKAYVREGYAMLVGYLPIAFEARGTLPELYGEGLQEIIAPTIGLLADDVEAVREAATGSCHQIVSRVARIDRVAIFDVLLETLSDRRWRCRLGCLQLFQEFLSKFSLEESDATMGIFATPRYEELVEGGIDADRVNSLMAKAFLYRFDNNSSAIRHLSLTIWKGLASHPLRALTCILPLLLREACVLLSKETSERDMVAKAMEDILTKIGDRVIISILETLKKLFEEGFEVPCIFIASQLAYQFGSPSFPSAAGNVTERVLSLLADLINIGLFSALEKTRSQACVLFKHVCDTSARMVLQANIFDVIVGPMLEELLTDEVVDPVTLSALVSLLGVDESGSVLKLTQGRLHDAWKSLSSPEHGTTLCSITASVFDRLGANGAHISVQLLRVIISSIHYHSIKVEASSLVIRSLLSALEADADSPYQISLSQLLESLYSEERYDDCFRIIGIYCLVEDADLSRFYNLWPLRICEHIVDSEAAQNTIVAMTETVRPEDTVSFANTLVFGMEKIKELAASCKPMVAAVIKHIVIPLLLASNLLAAEDEERRSLACRIVVILAKRATLTAWSASLTSLVGALIRTASDKKTTGIMVFDALTQCVLAQINAVKPFYPQLQRIFLNGLAFEAVQEISVAALISLIPALPRPEQTISELLTVAQTACDGQISALKVMKQTPVVTDPRKYIETARICMASDNPTVRNMASQWIQVISTLPQMSHYETQLTSLLQLA